MGMTYNRRTKTLSVRIDRGALRVLKWHSALTGKPLASRLRDDLESEAEKITETYNLALPDDGDDDEVVMRAPADDAPPSVPVEESPTPPAPEGTGTQQEETPQ